MKSLYWMLYKANSGWTIQKRPMFVVKGTEEEIRDLADSFWLCANHQGGTHITYDPIEVFESKTAVIELIENKMNEEYKNSIRGRIMSSMVR